MDTKQIALGLFLCDPKNKRAFENFLHEINCYLASLNPALTEKEKLALLVDGFNAS